MGREWVSSGSCLLMMKLHAVIGVGVVRGQQAGQANLASSYRPARATECACAHARAHTHMQDVQQCSWRVHGLYTLL